MSLRRVTVATLILLSLGGAVALADSNTHLSQRLAQNPAGGPPPHPPHGDMMQLLMNQLNLSASQKQQIETIRNNSKTQMQQAQQTLRQDETQLRDLMMGTATDDQINAQYQKVKADRTQLSDLQFQNLLAMRDVLTPQQRQQAAQMMQQHQPMFRNRSGNQPKPQTPQ